MVEGYRCGTALPGHDKPSDATSGAVLFRWESWVETRIHIDYGFNNVPSWETVNCII